VHILFYLINVLSISETGDRPALRTRLGTLRHVRTRQSVITWRMRVLMNLEWQASLFFTHWNMWAL